MPPTEQVSKALKRISQVQGPQSDAALERAWRIVMPPKGKIQIGLSSQVNGQRKGSHLFSVFFLDQNDQRGCLQDGMEENTAFC